MSPWAVLAILAGLILGMLLVFVGIDWVVSWHLKRVFLKRLVEIAREHQLDHSRYLYPED